MATTTISVWKFLFFFPLQLHHLHNKVLLISTFNTVLKKYYNFKRRISSTGIESINKIKNKNIEVKSRKHSDVL